MVRILETSTKLQIYRIVDNKQLMSTAATMHCTLPSCVVLCSVDLLGSVKAEGNDHEFDIGVSPSSGQVFWVFLRGVGGGWGLIRPHLLPPRILRL